MGEQVMEFRAVGLTGEGQVKAFRAYLPRWWSRVGQMSSLSSPDAPDEELVKPAAAHPVFKLM
jgi:hypothetical protein